MKRTINLPKLFILTGLSLCTVIYAHAQTGLSGNNTAQNDNEFFISESVYIREGAKVYVMGDVVVGNNNAQLENEGKLQIQGNFILAPGAILKSFNGTVVMKNNVVNQNLPQFLDGDFTGSNTIPKLVINKFSEGGLVYLKNGDLDIGKRLRFKNGRLRTGPEGHDSGTDYPFKVSMLNDNPNAIVGHADAYSTSNYIEGKLQRAVGLGPYFFPVGPRPSEGEGIEPFEINFLAMPASDILGYYDNGTSTPIGTVVDCDLGENGPIEPDDDDDDEDEDEDDENVEDGMQSDLKSRDDYVVNCVAGQWVVEALPLVYFYDIHFFPSQRVLGQCDFESFYMARNGIIESICPINEYALYDQKIFGTFDIPGKAGPGLNLADEPTYFESLPGGQTLIHDPNANYPKGSKTDFQDNKASLIHFFPNPVSIDVPEIGFEVENGGPLSISVYDNMAVLIATQTIDASPGVNKIKLLPKTISAGVYHIVIRDGSKASRGLLAVVR